MRSRSGQLLISDKIKQSKVSFISLGYCEVCSNNILCKMPKRCVVVFCGNTSQTGHSLHEFPKDPDIRRQWIHFVQSKRENFPSASVKSAVICSAHFEDNCFHGSLMRSMGFDVKRRVLIPGSIPTIQPVPTPEQLSTATGRKQMTKSSPSIPTKVHRKGRKIYSEREVGSVAVSKKI